MKYRVVIGDPFGGHACVKADLEKEEADRIAAKEELEADYFTSVLVVEDDDRLFKHLIPMET